MVADVMREFGHLTPDVIRRVLAIALAPTEDRRQAAADRRRDVANAHTSLPFSHNVLMREEARSAAQSLVMADVGLLDHPQSDAEVDAKNIEQWQQYLRARFSHLGYDEGRLLEMAELLNDSPVPAGNGDDMAPRLPLAMSALSVGAAVRLLELDVEAGVIKLASIAGYPLTDDVRMAAIDMLPLSWPRLPQGQLIDRVLRKWSYDARLSDFVNATTRALGRGDVPRDVTRLSEDDIKRILWSLQTFAGARLGKVGSRLGADLIRPMVRGQSLMAYAHAMTADPHLMEIAERGVEKAHLAMTAWRQRRIAEHGKAPESPMWPFCEAIIDEPR
jgi:hypothetical protein